jgi:hypothetical protein
MPIWAAAPKRKDFGLEMSAQVGLCAYSDEDQDRIMPALADSVYVIEETSGIVDAAQRQVGKKGSKSRSGAEQGS